MAPMTMTSLQFRTRVRLTLLTSAVVAAVTFTGAQQPAIPAAVLAASLDQTVPVDPLITVGTLPNGFRYYIRENRQPQGRAELRLAVNVGSVLEDDDQLGLAHFVGPTPPRPLLPKGVSASTVSSIWRRCLPAVPRLSEPTSVKQRRGSLGARLATISKRCFSSSI